MEMRRILIGLLGFLLPVLLQAQGMPSSSLTGRLTSEDGTPISGVRATLESRALQGRREAATSATGEYFFDLLPPGEYEVTFRQEGLETAQRQVVLEAASRARVDAVLRPAPVKESVSVSGEAQRLSFRDDLQASANYRKTLVDRLPIDRSLRSIALLAPGVNDNGPSSSTGSASERAAITISGAPSFENLFLINGVVANENIRGQPQDLFIEDAIAETTVLTGRISAEYGRFTGGVVDAITRSGGNQLHGSFRTTLTNDDWTANNPYDSALGVDHRTTDLNETYEATLGGPLWRDRIWFFGAGRLASLNDSRSTRPTALPGDVNPTPVAYVHGTDEGRGEGKLTLGISSGHELVASYIGVKQKETNFAFNQNILDTDGSLTDIERPYWLLALHYDGVLSQKLFLEAQYSRRSFTIEQQGPTDTSLIGGTRIFDTSRALAGYYSLYAPILVPQQYDNDSWLLKASSFLSSTAWGSHDMRFGVERFGESAAANQHATGSDFRVNVTSSIIRGTEVFPSIHPGDTIRWSPIAEQSDGTDLVTYSAFVNDRIDWSTHWSFNVGLRYDKNHDRDSNGLNVSEHASWSPRLALLYDPSGSGRFRIEAGYARYVDKIQDNLADRSSPVGQRSDFFWRYRGACINCDVKAPTDSLVPTDQALQQLFAWFAGVGGVKSPPISATIPGLSTRISPDGLRSPNVKEFSVGVQSAFGAGNSVRVDFLYRDYDDFYSSRIDSTTGQSAPDPLGRTYDMSVIGNSNLLDRRYEGVQTQFQFRIFRGLALAGSYTWSRLTGNFGAENRAVSAIPANVEEYPEYKQQRWSFPTGYISSGFPIQAAGDQRHRLRAWILRDLPVPSGILNISLLQAYDSGQPYEVAGPIDDRAYVVNPPAYRTPPQTVSYFFTSPGTFRTDDISHTDIALNWTIPVGGSFELFLRPEVWNLFNQKGVIAVDTTVYTAANQTSSMKLKPFNPFTDTPVLGVNYAPGPNFGKPTSSASYQQPRTFRLGVGARF
jgi:carboxypeptidase family protein/TonB-dependent receptor-like protein